MISSLPPHTSGTEPDVAQPRRAVAVSMACAIAAGGLFLIVAPQPESGVKQGATRSSAVPSGTFAMPQGQSQAGARGPVKADVKIIGASAESSKPCDEQTWPYIDQRCLTSADRKTTQDNKSAPRPLGLRDMLAGVRPAHDNALAASAEAAPAADQPVGSVTAIAPTPPVDQMQASRVGAGARDDTDTDDVDTSANASPANVADIPLPQPRPGIALTNLGASEDAEDADVDPPVAVPLSRREQRQLRREQRRVEREQRRLDRAERRSLERRMFDPNRTVRSWTESGYGDDSRVIVIREGSRRDRFFHNYR